MGWAGAGQTPILPAAAGGDSVLLANGDEAQGTVEIATPDSVKLDSEAGEIDLPVSRLTAIDFGARADERRGGRLRLRLSGRGTLTAKSYRFENGVMFCESEVAGPLRLPVASLQEMTFNPTGSGKAGERSGR